MKDDSIFVFDPMVQHHFAAGLYARQMVLPAGKCVISHKHKYDHFSILASGDCVVKTDEGEQSYSAPACILIKKDLNHGIYAKSDVVWFCIHAADVADVDDIDSVLIGE